MTLWLAAALVGLVLTVASYAPVVRQEGAAPLPLALLRWAAATLLLALLLDAPAGPPRPSAPLVAIDVSRSWTRGDSTRWPPALARARAIGGDSVLAFGDSVRLASTDARPTDAASSLAALVATTGAQQRPVVIVTDGEADLAPADAEALPRGSRIEVVPAPSLVDLAVVAGDGPRAAASGDTLRLQVVVRAGNAPTPAAVLEATVGGRSLARTAIPPLPAHGSRAVVVAGRLVATNGVQPVAVVVHALGDVEPRNDTLWRALDVSPAATAVWISSAPDLDGRAALAVLRATLGESVAAYLRVAPSLWRTEGSLLPVAEGAVHAAARAAPLLVLHGDTAIFGPPRALAGDAPLALLPGPGPGTTDRAASPLPDEWYPSAAPPSPAAAALVGIPWDSLPPVALGAAIEAPGPVAGTWTAIEGRRARAGAPVPLVIGAEAPRRVVVARATGLWRWRTGGGAGAAAYDGLWGSLFDWLADARRDRRLVMPEGGVLREGETLRWRVADADSSWRVLLRRRDAPGAVDTLMLQAEPGTMLARSPAPAAGLYDVDAPGGRSLLAVNVSHELLPQAPTLRAGDVGRGAPVSAGRPLRGVGLAYAALVALLCVEWVLRRRRGLR